MKRFAFISNNVPTVEQIQLAKAQNIQLVPCADIDAFMGNITELINRGNYDGLVVFHPALAVRALNTHLPVGIFRNNNHEEIGGNPKFLATELYLYFLTINCPDMPDTNDYVSGC